MNEKGYYGRFGGAFIPEILVATFEELTAAFEDAKADPTFWQAFEELMSTYSCRPTPITFAENLTEHFGGARIYIKREDLNHTGAHKANNVMGQGLLIQRMGKTRVIAETGAGQHGVATATMAAKFGLDCTIYMGEVDVLRQRPNVFWMERMGAEVVPVTEGTRTLKDAINEAFRDWVTNMDTTHYALGTACGPHPFPEMVSWFQSIIGREARAQMLDRVGRLPDRVYACVGGGSNAMGIFSGFFDDDVELVGVEAGGEGVASGRHAARLAGEDASLGVAQGYLTYFLQNPDGQMNETHSVAAGLDYVGVSPILAHLHETGRVRFESATDKEVVDALTLTLRKEGLIPALESTHAFVQGFQGCADDVERRGDSHQSVRARGTRTSSRWRMRSEIRPGRTSSGRRRRCTVLEQRLREALTEKDILLMTHIVVGYPKFDDSMRVVESMVEAGVDIMELQIPFSDPMADGPVILHANQRALEAGSTVERCLEFGEAVAQRFDIPFLVMTYYNILFKYGVARFAKRMAEAGLVGAIVPDLPPGEAEDYLREMKQHDLAPVFIFSPNTTDERMRTIAASAEGLVYCVARKGVTGAETDFSEDLNQYLARCRSATSLPLALGFGVKDAEDVALLKGRADLAVIGTQTIRVMEEQGVDAVRGFIEGLR